MSYVQSTIGKDEKIIYNIYYHWSYVIIAYLYLFVFGVFIIGIILFFKMMIDKWTTERVLTNKRYIQKTGWISRKTEEISINKIEEVEMFQSILGRILNYDPKFNFCYYSLKSGISPFSKSYEHINRSLEKFPN